jgi:hypothetical protein
VARRREADRHVRAHPHPQGRPRPGRRLCDRRARPRRCATIDGGPVRSRGPAVPHDRARAPRRRRRPRRAHARRGAGAPGWPPDRGGEPAGRGRDDRRRGVRPGPSRGGPLLQLRRGGDGGAADARGAPALRPGRRLGVHLDRSGRLLRPLRRPGAAGPHAGRVRRARAGPARRAELVRLAGRPPTSRSAPSCATPRRADST